jgi:hypothetical protein
MSVVPVNALADGNSFESVTSGLNAVGAHTANDGFFNSTFPPFEANFTNADNEGEFPTFSSGVIGTTGIPEPSTWAMRLLYRQARRAKLQAA